MKNKFFITGLSQGIPLTFFVVLDWAIGLRLPIGFPLLIGLSNYLYKH